MRGGVSNEWNHMTCHWLSPSATLFATSLHSLCYVSLSNRVRDPPYRRATGGQILCEGFTCFNGSRIRLVMPRRHLHHFPDVGWATGMQLSGVERGCQKKEAKKEAFAVSRRAAGKKVKNAPIKSPANHAETTMAVQA